VPTVNQVCDGNPRSLCIIPAIRVKVFESAAYENDGRVKRAKLRRNLSAHVHTHQEESGNCSSLQKFQETYVAITRAQITEEQISLGIMKRAADSFQ
jgi:hypothetical protein